MLERENFEEILEPRIIEGKLSLPITSQSSGTVITSLGLQLATCFDSSAEV